MFAFFICWAPFHAQRLVAFYYRDEQTFRTIYAITTYLSGVLYYLSTCVNPVLYHLMSNKFREAFKVCEKNIINPTQILKDYQFISTSEKLFA